jgi:hypothetical protein
VVQWSTTTRTGRHSAWQLATRFVMICCASFSSASDSVSDTHASHSEMARESHNVRTTLGQRWDNARTGSRRITWVASCPAPVHRPPLPPLCTCAVILRSGLVRCEHIPRVFEGLGLAAATTLLNHRRRCPGHDIHTRLEYAQPPRGLHANPPTLKPGAPCAMSVGALLYNEQHFSHRQNTSLGAAHFAPSTNL